MYTLLQKLEEEKIKSLNDLLHSVNFQNKDIRPGKNAPQIMSVYNHSKWYNWQREQKNNFIEALSNYSNTAVVGWFLSLPADGFLDTMDYWQNMVSAGTITAFSLTDNNPIIIEGSTLTIERGAGIQFHLKQLHEIRPATFERNWACLMQLI